MDLGPTRDDLRCLAPWTLAALGLAAALGCAGADRPAPGGGGATVREIPLDGEVATSPAELSGLAWLGDLLVLLPQFPSRFPVEGAPGSLFAVDRADVDAWREGRRETLVPRPIAFDPSAVATLEGYEGFEAIAFDGDLAYLTIEVGGEEGARGYLVRARLDTAAMVLALEGDPVEIPSGTLLRNLAYETLILSERGVLALHEALSRRVNPTVAGRLFSPQLDPLPDVAVPDVEYRITDATDVDEAGRFWAINYQYRGDEALLPPGQAPLALERLIELSWRDDGVATTDRVIDLGTEGEGRNWEGIVRYGDGRFIVATDRHPRTILALVEAR